jgi:hypothetical protein
VRKGTLNAVLSSKVVLSLELQQVVLGKLRFSLAL